jgi:hypothetical protein
VDGATFASLLSREMKMTNTSKLFLALFAFALAFIAATRAAERVTQPLPALSDLENAKSIAIKDSSGQILLRGAFTAKKTSKNETELTALLSGASAAAQANGKAEIEIERKNGSMKQELELSVKKLPAAAGVKVVIDGAELATVTANHEGEVELKLSSAL